MDEVQTIIALITLYLGWRTFRLEQNRRGHQKPPEQPPEANGEGPKPPPEGPPEADLDETQAA